MNPRTQHRILDLHWYTPASFRLRLERKGFPFKAGQNINMGIPGGGINREYTVYSGEHDDFIDILVRQVQGGSLTPRLAALKPGDIVEVHGPYSRFMLPDPIPSGARFVFVATGTGVAPFHSMVKTLPKLDYLLVHGVRQKDETYDAGDYPAERYLPCFTREDAGFRGRVTDYLRAHPQGADAWYYVCGNRAMINDLYDLLRAQGVGGDHIMTEVFF
ncbi:MAG: oxidoreductase [Spirochaetes bacterium]|nr:oxidoreductase [Spirochaetota bacterium]